MCKKNFVTGSRWREVRGSDFTPELWTSSFWKLVFQFQMVYKWMLCVQISPLLLSFSYHSISSKSGHFEHLLKRKIYENEKQTGWIWDDFSSKSKRLKMRSFFKKYFFLESRQNGHLLWVGISILGKKFKKMCCVAYGWNSLLLNWTPCSYVSAQSSLLHMY